MNFKISRIRNDELVRGGFILFLMMIIYNVFNYAFQISTAKILGPADYGVLAVLMSFLYIFSIPSEAIQTAISRYISKFNIKKEFGKMKDLAYRSLRRGVFFSLVMFLVFLPLAFFLSEILKISFWTIAFTGLFIFFVFSVPIIRGILQGRKKFLGLGVNLVIEGGVKFIFALVLVLAGAAVYGALVGVLIGSLVGFFIAFSVVREVFSSKREYSNFENVYSTNLPVLLAVTSIVLMYSLDIILARAFFRPEVAGQYAFVSMIGKTILFVSLAVGKAMFPLSSEGFENGRKTSGLLKKSVILVAMISAVALLFFLLFPQQVIRIISLGSGQYLAASNILFITGVSFSLISFANIALTYNLSIRKKSNYSFLIGIIVLEVILLSIFHSSLLEFSLALLFSSAIMFLYSLFLAKK